MFSKGAGMSARFSDNDDIDLFVLVEQLWDSKLTIIFFAIASLFMSGLYSIASIKDYKNIQLFIKENWSKDHILCKNNRVFEHYFLRGNELQFFLAKDKDKNIVGILGYITNTQFDPKIAQDVAWLSMWMSKKNLSEPCGIKLINYLESNIDTDYIASMGVGSDVIPIYERMG